MSSDTPMTKEGGQLGLVFLIVSLIIGIISGIVWMLSVVPISIYNNKINKSSIDLYEISYADSLVTSENGILLEGSAISPKILEPFTESKKELFYLYNYMDYNSRPFNVNMDYSYNKIEIIGEPEIVFKTYAGKNLIHLNYSGKVHWYIDETKTTTQEVESNFYYIGYNLQSTINGDLSVENEQLYICDKSFEEGYKLFEKSFRSSYYLNGHILYKFNNYDEYKECNIISDSLFFEGLNDSIVSIYNSSVDGKRFTLNTLPVFMNSKSKKINYGTAPIQILIAGPDFMTINTMY